MLRLSDSPVLRVQFFEFELQLYEHEYECQLSPMLINAA